MSVCDDAITILQKTKDGDNLSPQDLALVQFMVNASVYGVTEAAEAAFEDLKARVAAGYQPRWLGGVEHLTRDHEGFVYWKGQQIEHWSTSLAADADRAPIKAAELASRCRLLEEHGWPINVNSVIWGWEA